MFKGTQGAYSKNADKSIKFHMAVPAIFLDYGPDDLSEVSENKVKDESPNPKGFPDEKGVLLNPSIRKVTQPVETDKTGKKVVSKYDPDVLLAEAIAYYQEASPKDNPILGILSDANVGLNMRLKLAAVPAKEVDKMAVVAKLIKDMQKLGMSLEVATKQANLILASTAPESETQEAAA